MSKPIALQCTIHTSSSAARSETLSRLQAAAKSYYTLTKAQCRTWSYFIPSTRKGAISQNAPSDFSDLTIGGIEIYTDKRALTTQQNEQWFKDYQRKAQDEQLIDLTKAGGKGEELVAWYPAAGFVSRGGSGASGKGTVVCIAKFIAKDGQADKVVDGVSKYTEDWVRPNEPGVLTYCTMTRPKAPNEVLLFERYADMKAFGAHGSTKAFKGMFKSIAPYIEVKRTQIQEWEEIDDSFVGNGPGGVEDYARAKL